MMTWVPWRYFTVKNWFTVLQNSDPAQSMRAKSVSEVKKSVPLKTSVSNQGRQQRGRDRRRRDPALRSTLYIFKDPHLAFQSIFTGSSRVLWQQQHQKYISCPPDIGDASLGSGVPQHTPLMIGNVLVILFHGVQTIHLFFWLDCFQLIYIQ